MQNLSEFRSGADYDAQYGNLYEEEIAYLTALAREQNGAILDVCCGSGIVTVPLAEAEFEVVGVDISPSMLARAQEKAKHLPNASFHLANALDFKLDKCFDLALMTGNAFQGFLTEKDVLRLLQNIRRHLNTDGILMFDTRLLEGYDLSVNDDFELWSEYTDASGDTVRWLGRKTRFDSQNNLLYFDMKRRYTDGREVDSSIEIKFLPLETLLSLVEEAGFEVLGKYADWQASSFNPTGSSAVFKLKKV